MNKPVAWMLNGKLHEFDPSDWAKEEYPDDDVIPLYTHSVKEPMMVLDGNRVYPAFKALTDGEIQEISHQYHYTYNPDYVGFARAILRKAQEK